MLYQPDRMQLHPMVDAVTMLDAQAIQPADAPQIFIINVGANLTVERTGGGGAKRLVVPQFLELSCQTRIHEWSPMTLRWPCDHECPCQNEGQNNKRHISQTSKGPRIKKVSMTSTHTVLHTFQKIHVCLLLAVLFLLHIFRAFNLSRQSLNLERNSFGPKSLIWDLLPQTSTAFFDRADVPILRGEPTLKKPCTILRTEPGLPVERFYD